uniref:Uncharacterized protein n=1 Tax=Populus alba TaxID=43335 RepID=A0A4U5QNC7_POPAL|nr:hypothetical protein D5086_0000064430 [Populus alba]
MSLVGGRRATIGFCEGQSVGKRKKKKKKKKKKKNIYNEEKVRSWFVGGSQVREADGKGELQSGRWRGECATAVVLEKKHETNLWRKERLVRVRPSRGCGRLRVFLSKGGSDIP